MDLPLNLRLMQCHYPLELHRFKSKEIVDLYELQRLYREESIRVARLKLKTLREMNDQDLADKLSELKADLAKLRLEKSKGTLKKQTANIKWLRRDVARMITILNERKETDRK